MDELGALYCISILRELRELTGNPKIIADKPKDRSSPVLVTQEGHGTLDHELQLGTNLDEDFDIFSASGVMSGTGQSSPFVKEEPEELNLNATNFFNYNSNYDIHGNPTFRSGNAGSVNPSELSMNGYGQYPFASQQDLVPSMGNSGIGDDELMESLDTNMGPKQNNHHHPQMGHPSMMAPHAHPHQMYPNQGPSMHHNPQSEIFSHTPDGGPIQSPFLGNNFNYGQFMPNSQPQQQQSLSNHVSPYMRPVTGMAAESNFINARPRGSVHYLDRTASDTRSPKTPKTPALGGLNLGGTPDSGNFGAQPIQANQHRHQKSLSNQWDSTPGSLQSYIDSPMASPGGTMNHHQITEVLRTQKPASLPAKVDTPNGSVTHGAYQSQEAKRRRRRESHNLVERRRRDNINERIQELSHLVPQHRLEDEKVRKHLANNSPLSPPLGAIGISPPQATSLLAAGGRRATGAGNITMGIPIEEKDKGPNKGDILNGSVGWTRDLMWALHVKLQQEAELASYIQELGGTFPFEQTEDELRMRTELTDAMEKNDPNSFQYTRGVGTGLRVPKHTNLAGDPLDSRQGSVGGIPGSNGQMGVGAMSPQSLSPGPGGRGQDMQNGQDFWSGQMRGGSMGFKEEDEYGMEMN